MGVLAPVDPFTREHAVCVSVDYRREMLPLSLYVRAFFPHMFNRGSNLIMPSNVVPLARLLKPRQGLFVTFNQIRGGPGLTDQPLAPLLVIPVEVKLLAEGQCEASSPARVAITRPNEKH